MEKVRQAEDFGDGKMLSDSTCMVMMGKQNLHRCKNLLHIYYTSILKVQENQN